MTEISEIFEQGPTIFLDDLIRWSGRPPDWRRASESERPASRAMTQFFAQNILCRPRFLLYIPRLPHRRVKGFITWLGRVFCRPHPDCGRLFVDEHAND